MDLGTLVGLILTIVVILIGILLSAGLMIFIDAPSIMIVLGATIGVTLVKWKINQIVSLSTFAFKTVFFEQSEEPRELIAMVEDFAKTVQREGVLALESVEVKNKLLAKGIQLMVDGHAPEFVRGVLENESRVQIEMSEKGEALFRGIGDSAPGMGMIGTLVGLIIMLNNMSDPSSIGPAMAVALITTLYGAVIAQVFAIPLADKLALNVKKNKEYMYLIIESVNAMQTGQSPRVMVEMLNTFLAGEHIDNPKALKTAQNN
ncbi:MAG: flagellar motor protein PomA [Candidatus Kapaibacteriales bacterium]